MNLEIEIIEIDNEEEETTKIGERQKTNVNISEVEDGDTQYVKGLIKETNKIKAEYNMEKENAENTNKEYVCNQDVESNDKREDVESNNKKEDVESNNKKEDVESNNKKKDVESNDKKEDIESNNKKEDDKKEKDENNEKKKDMQGEKSKEIICCGCQTQMDKKKHCPICLKYKVNSYFCSQDCYVKSWEKHKKLHDTFEKIKSIPDEKNEKPRDTQKEVSEEKTLQLVKIKLLPKNYDPNNRIYWIYDRHLRKFLNFKFTGKIKPWPITPMRTVPDHIEKPDYAISSVPELELKIKNKRDIYVNTEEDIVKIRAASILGRKTLDYAHSLVRPGISTDEIDEKVHNFIISNNAYPSTLNYYKFPKSCCTSVNEIICHGIPDTRPLEKGDIINIDISVFYNGVHSDLNETFFVGQLDDISEEAKELVETTYFSLMEAIKNCRPGMLYKNIGNIIESYVKKKKFSVVRTYSGHGVGKCFHSNPTIPHYKKNKAVGIMQPGHVFTIEPMINQGCFDDILWPDKWTSATTDGKLSAQFEHTLLITKEGVEVLTKRLPDSPSLGFDTKDHLYYT